MFEGEASIFLLKRDWKIFNERQTVGGSRAEQMVESVGYTMVMNKSAFGKESSHIYTSTLLFLCTPRAPLLAT